MWCVRRSVLLPLRGSSHIPAAVCDAANAGQCWLNIPRFQSNGGSKRSHKNKDQDDGWVLPHNITNALTLSPPPVSALAALPASTAADVCNLSESCTCDTNTPAKQQHGHVPQWGAVQRALTSSGSAALSCCFGTTNGLSGAGSSGSW